MQIIENLLTQDQQNHIEKCALEIPWYFQDNTCDYSYIPNYRGDKNIKETPFFVNMMVDEFETCSDYFKYFIPVIRSLENKTGRNFMNRLFRFKANMYLNQRTYPIHCYHTPHVDVYDEKTDTVGEGEIFLYYADETDGDTIFFNENFGVNRQYTIKKKIKPVKGRGVLFDLQNVHSSSPPRKHERRITLNFVFRKD